MADPTFLPRYSQELITFHKRWMSTRGKNFFCRTLYRKSIEDFSGAFDHIAQVKTSSKFLSDTREIFKQQIMVSNAASAFYLLFFNVAQTEQYIRDNQIQVSPLNIKRNPYLYSDTELINPQKLAMYELQYSTVTKPVITVFHPYIFAELVIDGNHRIQQADRKGIEHVPAYRLSPNDLYRVIQGDQLGHALYVLHHNLSINPLYFSRYYHSLTAPKTTTPVLPERISQVLEKLP
jgi:hypothetical protein